MSSAPHHHDPLPPMTACSGGAVGWTQASCRLPAHPVLPTCVCMRCVWRRVHSVFWESLPVGAIACNNMPPRHSATRRDLVSDEEEDSMGDIQPGTPPSGDEFWAAAADGILAPVVIEETLPLPFDSVHPPRSQPLQAAPHPAARQALTYRPHPQLPCPLAVGRRTIA